MLIFIPRPCILWISNCGKGNPLQLMSIDSKWKPKDATSQMMLQLLESLSTIKNAHSLATHIDEKGPQMLTDTISEVEKLNAAQQPTAMIIPPSTVNIMLNKEDCCFQCQEPGHIAQHCPHTKCYECDAFVHIFMDCPHKIPPLGTQQPHHKPHRGHHARLSLRHHYEDRDR